MFKVLTFRNLIWLFASTFYNTFSSMAIVYIGHYNHNNYLTFNLLVGAVLWTFLGSILDGVILVTNRDSFDVKTTTLFSLFVGFIKVAVLLLVCLPFFKIQVVQVDLVACVYLSFLILLAFLGIGYVIGGLVLLFGPGCGVQSSLIIQGFVILVSGVYYPIDVFPSWLKAASFFSPATYAVSFLRSTFLHGNSIYQELFSLRILSISILLVGICFIFLVKKVIIK